MMKDKMWNKNKGLKNINVCWFWFFRERNEERKRTNKEFQKEFKNKTGLISHRRFFLQKLNRNKRKKSEREKKKMSSNLLKNRHYSRYIKKGEYKKRQFFSKEKPTRRVEQTGNHFSRQKKDETWKNKCSKCPRKKETDGIEFFCKFMAKNW